MNNQSYCLSFSYAKERKKAVREERWRGGSLTSGFGLSSGYGYGYDYSQRKSLGQSQLIEQQQPRRQSS